MRTPGKVYLVHDGSTWIAFVHTVGGYIKTHWCCVIVRCPHKSGGCGARPGEPCRGADGLPVTDTHYVRRDAARVMKTKPAVRKRLRRAMPAAAFALDKLCALDDRSGDRSSSSSSGKP